MIELRSTLRRIAVLLFVATAFTFPRVAWTQCAGVSEEGEWRNLDKKAEPAFIYITMVGGCGDQSLNGEQTGSTALQQDLGAVPQMRLELLQGQRHCGRASETSTPRKGTEDDHRRPPNA